MLSSSCALSHFPHCETLSIQEGIHRRASMCWCVWKILLVIIAHSHSDKLFPAFHLLFISPIRCERESRVGIDKCFIFFPFRPAVYVERQARSLTDSSNRRRKCTESEEGRNMVLVDGVSHSCVWFPSLSLAPAPIPRTLINSISRCCCLLFMLVFFFRTSSQAFFPFFLSSFHLHFLLPSTTCKPTRRRISFFYEWNKFFPPFFVFRSLPLPARCRRLDGINWE